MTFLDDADDELSDEQLIELVEDQRDLLIAVATGTSITPDYERQYGRRRRAIKAELERRGLRSPFRWQDLRQFWGAVAAPTMTTYRQRREFVHGLVGPVIERLESGRAGVPLEDWGDTREGWEALDRRIDGLRRELASGEELDDWQDIGRRSREIVLELTALVFEESMVPSGADVPRRGDAKQRLDLYLSDRIPGPENAELRTVVRAAWDLANKVVHGHVTRAHAYAAAQATLLLVRTIAAVEAGRSA